MTSCPKCSTPAPQGATEITKCVSCGTRFIVPIMDVGGRFDGLPQGEATTTAMEAVGVSQAPGLISSKAVEDEMRTQPPVPATSTSPKIARRALTAIKWIAVICVSIYLMVDGAGGLFRTAAEIVKTWTGNHYVDGPEPSPALVAKIGPRPTRDWQVNYHSVAEYRASTLGDPGALEFLAWGAEVRGLEEVGWMIKCQYRAKNEYGALMISNKVFAVKQGKVTVAIDDPSPMR